MSFVKAANVQVGTGPSASNNFHWRNLLDGLLRLSRGNAGSPITDVMTVNADNSVSFPGGITNKNQCTAWVNFNGTGTVAIRDSYNVSSITDNGGGDYTVNFATAMLNANYAVAMAASGPSVSNGQGSVPQLDYSVAPSVGSVRVNNKYSASAGAGDTAVFCVSIFGGV